jgi:hypothetical protein
VTDIHDHPLNEAIDRMLDGDRQSQADDLLVKVREMCAKVPLADLRVAIAVHKDNCHLMSCPVLAAMEESAALPRPTARQSAYAVEFKLSMPGRASWDGGWSGADRNFTKVRELTADQVVKLFGLPPDSFDVSKCKSSWTHRWDDGWIAEVSARVVPAGEELAMSDGFHGYDWMIDNILQTGSPYNKAAS